MTFASCPTEEAQLSVAYPCTKFPSILRVKRELKIPLDHIRVGRKRQMLLERGFSNSVLGVKLWSAPTARQLLPASALLPESVRSAPVTFLPEQVNEQIPIEGRSVPAHQSRGDISLARGAKARLRKIWCPERERGRKNALAELCGSRHRISDVRQLDHEAFLISIFYHVLP